MEVQSDELKAKITSVLTKEYMSSDESEASEDEGGNLFITGYATKSIPWEKPNLTNLKRKLDMKYLQLLPERSRKGILERKMHSLPSNRAIPTNPPKWAVNTTMHSTPVTKRSVSFSL